MSQQSCAKTALVAESDRETRESICAYLRSGGWHCEVSDSSEITDPRLVGGGYDLLVIDVASALPSVVDHLKELRFSCPKQAVLLVANTPEFEDLLGTLRDSAVGVLTKPLDSSLLPVIVNRITSAIKIRDWETRIQDFIVSERVTYEFTTQQLSSVRFPLSVLSRLEAQGRLGYAEKLRLDLAFQEALANAIEHGNLELESGLREQINSAGEDLFSERKRARMEDSFYSDRKILVITEVLASHIEIRIRDQGKGFDTSKVVLAPRSLESCYGRGVALIRSAVDRLWFELGGREIVMVKGLTTGKPGSGK